MSRCLLQAQIGDLLVLAPGSLAVAIHGEGDR